MAFSIEAPLDVLPGDLQVRAAILSGFPRLTARKGGDVRAILERHDINPGIIHDPDRHIDCRSLANVLEYCSEKLEDPLFGLRLAGIQVPEVFGCVTALCRAASSMREAIACKIRYTSRVHSPESLTELEEGGDVVELRWRSRSDVGLNTQANHQAALLNAKLLHAVAGSDFRFRYVALAGDFRPHYKAEMQSIFGCEVRLNSQVNAIAFSPEAMERPIEGANRTLFRLLSGYLETAAMREQDSTMDRVGDFIEGSLPSSNCTIKLCAEKLGTSVRTLQTRLEEQGAIFSEMVEGARCRQARHYLGNSDMSLDEIAYALGYAEQACFGRAFKRWIGVTPLQYRKQFERLA